jgi:hypothetical protein
MVSDVHRVQLHAAKAFFQSTPYRLIIVVVRRVEMTIFVAGA